MSVVRRYCWQFHLKTFPVFIESLENNAQAYDATASITGATIFIVYVCEVLSAADKTGSDKKCLKIILI